MKLDYRSWFNFIFPLSADEELLQGIRASDFTSAAELCNYRQYTALSSYSVPMIRAAIHLVKYHQHRHATTLLAALLKNYYKTTQPQALIIPVPLSTKRLRERGYNQVETIIRAADVPYAKQMLKRTRHTPPQTSLTRKARLKNMTNAFTLKDPELAIPQVAGKDIILLDDVVTTGATLQAAARTLAPLPYKSLTCVALAH